MKNIKVLIYLSLLIAMEVVFTRFLSIQTPILRIGFSFLPVAIAAIMFGALPAGIAAAVADVLGMMIFPSGAFFPGFTLSAFLGGVIYGVILHNKRVSISRTIVSVMCITVFVDIMLNTYWLTILTGKAALVLLLPRLIKSSIMFPIQTALIYILWGYMEKAGHANGFYYKKTKMKC